MRVSVRVGVRVRVRVSVSESESESQNESQSECESESQSPSESENESESESERESRSESVCVCVCVCVCLCVCVVVCVCVNSCRRILLACQAEFGHQSKRSRSCTRQGELVCVHVFSVPVGCQSARQLTQCFVAIILEATDAPWNTSLAIGDALKFVHVSEERPCGPARGN